MKGTLKSKDSGRNFQFRKKLTTIGRDGCDISLQSPVIEKEHAVIEIDDTIGAFCIRDLNTPHGTYVNDSRVQNSAVKITSGDEIRFGHNGPAFEVQIDQSSFYYPPILSHQAWSTSDPGPDITTVGTQFPYIPSQLSADEIPSHQAGPTTLPYPNPLLYSSQMLDQTVSSHVMPHPPARSRPMTETSKHRGGLPTSTEERIHELEQRLLKMGDELSRLASFEAECYRKDGVIVSLRNEVANLKSLYQGSQTDVTYSIGLGGKSVDSLETDSQHLKKVIKEKEENERLNIQRFSHLQSQLSLKDRTIEQLEEDLKQMKLFSEQTSNNVKYTEKIAALQSEISKREQQVFNLQNELDKVKRQKAQSTNLVSTLQRESSAKDSIINKLRNEAEKLKREMKEKDNNISALSTKLAKQKVLKEAETENQRKVEEIVSLKQKIRNLESQLREKISIIHNLQEDLGKVRAMLSEEQKSDRARQQELHHTRSQFVDVERSERSLKIELKEWQSKYEKFQKKLVQTIFRLGVPVPSRELDDDDIVQQVRLICEERVDLQQRIKELDDKNGEGKLLLKKLDKWKHKFEKAVDHLEKKLLKDGRHCKILEEEANYFKDMKTPEEFAWVKSAVHNILMQEHRWQQELEEALEDIGFTNFENLKEPVDFMKELKEKMSDKENEVEALKRKLSAASRIHDNEITNLRTKFIEEAQESASDSITAIRREEEEKREKLIEKFEHHEKKAIQEALERERECFQREYGDLVEIRKRCNENQREADECRAKMIIVEQNANQLQASLDQYQHKEAQLQKELEDQETRHRVQLESVQKERGELEQRVEEEIKTFKEQARQHSLTIVALEEKVLKLHKDKKNLEFENMRYKQYGPGYYSPGDGNVANRLAMSKPATPERLLKKDVSVATTDLSGVDWTLREQSHKLEQLVQALRNEITVAQRENEQKDEVIRKLRKQLSGAEARLSDMTGELDDIQKQKIEDLQRKIRKQDEEMNDQRNQLLKLSSLVDDQKQELLTRERALVKHQDMLVRQKEEIDDRSKEIAHLKEIQEAERDGYDDEVTKLHEEHIQTKDLKAAGARCIGERHDEIVRKQKLALSELRAAIKSQGIPPVVTTQEAALSHIASLKKEVTDLRYQLATRDEDLGKSETVLHAEARASRELLHSASQEVTVEKNSHKDTLAALDVSEQSFFKLLRSVAGMLQIDRIPGTQPVAHIPREELQKLFKEREKGIKVIIKKMENLFQRLERKENLLDGYEKDLNHLRETEDLVGKKSAEALSLATNVRSQKDEIAYLREALNRVRDELDQQKRLNKSLSERKVFMMDYQNREQRKSSHKCASDDEKKYKEETKKKKQADKIKRKNYEIESLKRELQFADRELNQTAAKLHALEGSQSFRSQFEKDLLPADD